MATTRPENCAFCNPDELSGRVIGGNDLTVSFLSDPSLSPGHSLVIPRRHVEPPDRLTAQEMLAIDLETERITRAMLGSIATGVDVWQKIRPGVAQVIMEPK